MRYFFTVLTILALPVSASAQMFEGPTGAIPVTKCDPLSRGTICSTVDGATLTADQGYVRGDRGRLATTEVPAHTAAGG